MVAFIPLFFGSFCILPFPPPSFFDFFLMRNEDSKLYFAHLPYLPFLSYTCLFACSACLIYHAGFAILGYTILGDSFLSFFLSFEIPSCCNKISYLKVPL